MPEFIDPDKLNAERDTNKNLTVLDVRSPEEYAAGHVDGAVNIPLDQLESRLGEVPQNHPVVTYCNMYHPGRSRGEQAADLFQMRGYSARALNGGYPAWLDLNAELPSEDKTRD